MYRINLSEFDDFISGNNAGVISRASGIKRNSVLSGCRTGDGAVHAKGPPEPETRGRDTTLLAEYEGRGETCINMMKNPDKAKLDLAITSVQ